MCCCCIKLGTWGLITQSDYDWIVHIQGYLRYMYPYTLEGPHELHVAVVLKWSPNKVAMIMCTSVKRSEACVVDTTLYSI